MLKATILHLFAHDRGHISCRCGRRTR